MMPHRGVRPVSVPKAKRGEGKLEVLTKALDLADYTITVCKNEKSFPKRDRWIITNRIVEAVISIVECVRKANTIRMEREEDFLRRRQYQQEAMEHAEWALTVIDIAYRNLGLESSRVEHWTGLILEVERLLSAWRKSDRDAWRKKVSASKDD